MVRSPSSIMVFRTSGGDAEGFFAKLAKRRLKRGVFHSLVDLQAAINRFLAEHNLQPKPFTWTADPYPHHIAAVKRGHQALDSHPLVEIDEGDVGGVDLRDQ